MKYKLLLGMCLAAGLPIFLNSCTNHEDPAPTPAAVGQWSLDSYVFTELPSTFSNFENYALQEGSDVGIYGETSYDLNVKVDKTYERTLQLTGPDFNDTGSWTLDGTAFSLNSDDASIPDDDFGVVGDISAKQMVLSQKITVGLLPDAISDTLTSAWANAHPAQLDTLFQAVDVKVLFYFKK